MKNLYTKSQRATENYKKAYHYKKNKICHDSWIYCGQGFITADHNIVRLYVYNY